MFTLHTIFKSIRQLTEWEKKSCLGIKGNKQQQSWWQQWLQLQWWLVDNQILAQWIVIEWNHESPQMVHPYGKHSFHFGDYFKIERYTRMILTLLIDSTSFKATIDFNLTCNKSLHSLLAVALCLPPLWNSGFKTQGLLKIRITAKMYFNPLNTFTFFRRRHFYRATRLRLQAGQLKANALMKCVKNVTQHLKSLSGNKCCCENFLLLLLCLLTLRPQVIKRTAFWMQCC